VNRGGRENQNGGSQKKTGERESKQKIKCTEEISVIREEILKSNERETSGAHQNDVEGKKNAGRATCGPSSRMKQKTDTNAQEIRGI
jgi:hypothetical protein